MTSLEMYAATDVGIRRNHNEDCVKITPSHGIAVLADGMGGYNAGEVASAMAVDTISEQVKAKILSIPKAAIDSATGFTGESILLRQAIIDANEAIYRKAQSDRQCAGMGTTVLAAVFYADRITAAHVGDSRMYRLRGGILSHVTEDHSLIHEQVRRGLVTAADARNSMIKNLVTRALGIESGVEPDIVEDMVQPGDLYLMCSDGVTDVVADEMIQQTMSRYSKQLAEGAGKLIQLANDAGGPDNISVILIRADAEQKRGFLSRLLGK